ncbi:MAG: hypothetical protein KAS97_04190 [Candidatus Aminicenantes bacterium]|nr:hypothetical protein [Candidatus Aminicenantes bacterium]
MSDDKKHNYEKPVSVDAGKVASVLGAVCSTGIGAADGCVDGTDPHVAPVCTPGADASFNCGNGTVNDSTCWSGVTANGGGCDAGTSAQGTCTGGGTPL